MSCLAMALYYRESFLGAMVYFEFVGLVGGQYGLQILEFVLPEVVWRAPCKPLPLVDCLRLKADDFFQGQVWDALQFRGVAKDA